MSAIRGEMREIRGDIKLLTGKVYELTGQSPDGGLVWRRPKQSSDGPFLHRYQRFVSTQAQY